MNEILNFFVSFIASNNKVCCKKETKNNIITKEVKLEELNDSRLLTPIKDKVIGIIIKTLNIIYKIFEYKTF